MIIDHLSNHHLYPLGSAWNKAFEFLASLTSETEEGKYAIEGEDIFAIVMSYTTTIPENSLLESHQNYVDIQTVLDGAERFECAHINDLSITVPYDSTKDLILYEHTTPRPFSADITPGTFIMLYPHDAHMAALMIYDAPKEIKKVVVKIKTELLNLKV
ncbi:YhcH/YjgK/YiaL family protein [Sulfurovum sp. zt1-1]|uniref:YhcH/YjgK/YiaL family protein n=1 Tax=Sulfurovum zhangzhouensis TaxID=3019067 RepID=A0ABT7QV15_9BACT|nr:YhcH/YjgK/YiaL family protein [Sulfurovum zhangzhouensis]MDM5270693.1 YhcH/YjgK/YiaL family protein [Sulfurovum zhangzhouensis]